MVLRGYLILCSEIYSWKAQEPYGMVGNKKPSLWLVACKTNALRQPTIYIFDLAAFIILCLSVFPSFWLGCFLGCFEVSFSLYSLDIPDVGTCTLLLWELLSIAVFDCCFFIGFFFLSLWDHNDSYVVLVEVIPRVIFSSVHLLWGSFPTSSVYESVM